MTRPQAPTEPDRLPEIVRSADLVHQAAHDLRLMSEWAAPPARAAVQGAVDNLMDHSRNILAILDQGGARHSKEDLVSR